jgi:hypothetical protein
MPIKIRQRLDKLRILIYGKDEHSFIKKENYCCSGKDALDFWLNDDAMKSLAPSDIFKR